MPNLIEMTAGFSELDIALQELVNAANIRAEAAKTSGDRSLMLEALSTLSDILLTYSEAEEFIQPIIDAAYIELRLWTSKEREAEMALTESSPTLAERFANFPETGVFETLGLVGEERPEEVQARFASGWIYEAGSVEVPAEMMIHKPRWTYVPQMPTNHDELVETNADYGAFVSAYQYPDTNNWKRIVQYYNTIEARWIEHADAKDELGEWEKNFATKNGVAPTDEEIDAFADSLVTREDLTFVEAQSGKTQGEIVSRGMVDENQAKFLEAAMSEAWGEIEYFLVPTEFKQETEWRTRDAIRSLYEHKFSYGALDDIVSYEEKYAVAREVLDESAGTLRKINEEITSQVVAFWRNIDSHLADGYEHGIYYLVQDIVHATAEDEAMRPPRNIVQYEQYLPGQLDMTEADELIRQLQISLSARIENFAKYGTLPVSMELSVPTATRHTDDVAIGVDQIREKYGFKGFELFTERGLMPVIVQIGVINAKLLGAKTNANMLVGELQREVDGLSGVSQEELAQRVHFRVIDIVDAIDDILFDTMRSSLKAQEVWDEFFSYCNEWQIFNQLIYRTIFQGAQWIIGKSMGKVMDNFGGLRVAETQRQYNKAIAQMENAIRNSNFDRAYTQYIQSEYFGSMIPSIGSNLPSATNGVMPNERFGDALSKWHTSMVMNGNLPGPEDFYFNQYQAARGGQILDEAMDYYEKMNGQAMTATQQLTYVQRWHPMGHVESFSKSMTDFDNMLVRYGVAEIRTSSSMLNAIIPGLGTVVEDSGANMSYELALALKGEYQSRIPDEYQYEWFEFIHDQWERANGGEEVDENQESADFWQVRGIDPDEMLIAAVQGLVDSGGWEQIGVPTEDSEAIRLSGVLQEMIMDVYDDLPNNAGSIMGDLLSDISDLKIIARNQSEMDQINATYNYLWEFIVKPVIESEQMEDE